MVEQTVKASDYLDIGADKLNPCMLHVFPNGDEVFEQDRVPCDRARIVPEGSSNIILNYI